MTDVAMFQQVARTDTRMCHAVDWPGPQLALCCELRSAGRDIRFDLLLVSQCIVVEETPMLPLGRSHVLVAPRSPARRTVPHVAWR